MSLVDLNKAIEGYRSACIETNTGFKYPADILELIHLIKPEYVWTTTEVPSWQSAIRQRYGMVEPTSDGPPIDSKKTPGATDEQLTTLRKCAIELYLQYLDVKESKNEAAKTLIANFENSFVSRGEIAIGESKQRKEGAPISTSASAELASVLNRNKDIQAETVTKQKLRFSEGVKFLGDGPFESPLPPIPKNRGRLPAIPPEVEEYDDPAKFRKTPAVPTGDEPIYDEPKSPVPISAPTPPPPPADPPPPLGKDDDESIYEEPHHDAGAMPPPPPAVPPRNQEKPPAVPPRKVPPKPLKEDYNKDPVPPKPADPAAKRILKLRLFCERAARQPFVKATEGKGDTKATVYRFAEEEGLKPYHTEKLFPKGDKGELHFNCEFKPIDITEAMLSGGGVFGLSKAGYPYTVRDNHVLVNAHQLAGESEEQHAMRLMQTLVEGCMTLIDAGYKEITLRGNDYMCLAAQKFIEEIVNKQLDKHHQIQVKWPDKPEKLKEHADEWTNKYIDHLKKDENRTTLLNTTDLAENARNNQEFRADRVADQKIKEQREKKPDLLFISSSSLDDGHCFYRAVSASTKIPYEKLRQMTADYLAENQGEFAVFVATDADGNVSQEAYDAYVQAVEKDVKWADDAEIIALSKALEKPILVTQTREKSYTRPPHLELLTEFPEAEPVFVLYNGKNHYDGLVKGNETAFNNVISSLREHAAAAEEASASSKKASPTPRPGASG